MSDITVTVKDRDGNIHELSAPTDMAMNLMELCKAYELPVDGTCGGMAMCASCQVYIEMQHTLPEISDAEEAMLADAFHVKPISRLGCQIPISPEMNGMHFELAPE
ncbi:MAG: 2Fe-2S iron-sulfur cluster-binding protein [Flavobacteriaceae bacterium]|nr:2Fe-2S iron-sulfur cluster-binding protein [Flavobacteriaceae bacterium]